MLINSASAHNALRSMNSNAQVKLLGSMQTPSVPSLITTCKSSQKLSNGTPFHQLSTSNMPPLCPKLPSAGNRSSHEIITTGDSSITKNPPPLLPTPSIGYYSHPLTWPLIQVPLLQAEPQPPCSIHGLRYHLHEAELEDKNLLVMADVKNQDSSLKR